MPGVDAVMKPPLTPPGEDKISFDRHNKRLVLEYEKNNPNMPVVTKLMELSYAMWRQDILNNTHSIHEVLT